MAAKREQAEAHRGSVEGALPPDCSGCSAVTVREIAKQMRVSAELLQAYFEDEVALMAAQATSAVAELWLAYLDFLRDQEGTDDDGESHEWAEAGSAVAVHRARFVGSVESILATAGTSRRSRAIVAEHLWIGVRAMVAAPSQVIDDDVESHVRILLRGLLVPDAVPVISRSAGGKAAGFDAVVALPGVSFAAAARAHERRAAHMEPHPSARRRNLDGRETRLTRR